MERLKAEESRLREQQQYGDWQKKEEHFHLKQATQRSKVTNSDVARKRNPYLVIPPWELHFLAQAFLTS